jgi:hypothetical protein
MMLKSKDKFMKSAEYLEVVIRRLSPLTHKKYVNYWFKEKIRTSQM